MGKRTIQLLAIASLALAARSAGAEEVASSTSTVPPSVLDTLWVVVAGVLVMFMQAGFAMLEAGLTRAKNASNIMMKNAMDFAVGSLAYWAVGFAIMFGAGNALFGTSGFFLHDPGHAFDSLAWAHVPLEAKYFFQLVFAATAATIVSGAMAERTRFSAYLVYSFVVTLLIYPVVGHWIWGGGWLAQLGMWDFAGSTVVHSTGAWVALAGATILGPRLGKFDASGKPRAIPGHSMPLAALGVFILWFGWFGFNPGSTMAADLSIAHIAVTTNLAAAAGAVTAMAASWFHFGKPDTSMTLNGAVAGLVAITAPCAFVSPASAVVIGLVAGGLVVLSVETVEKRLRIDDPVGAISAHGVAGAWGTLAVGLFAQSAYGGAAPEGPGDGLLFGGGWHLLGVQALGVVAVMAWCLAAGALLFLTLRATIGLRVDPQEELEGLDVAEHGSPAYPDFAMHPPAAPPGSVPPEAAVAGGRTLAADLSAPAPRSV